MLAISLAPLGLSLSLRHPPLPSAVTHARVAPTVALLHELPAGFETLMPTIVDHTPFSRHLFNAIMGYMAVDTTLFAAKIVKRRMQPGVQEAARLAAAPTTTFGAAAISNRCHVPRHHPTHRTVPRQQRSEPPRCESFHHPSHTRAQAGCRPTCAALCLRWTSSTA